MSEFKFSCASCGQHLAADESWIGKQIQCPNCQTSLTVPPSTPSAPVPSPAAPPPVAGAGLPPRIGAPPSAAPPPLKSSPKALWIGLGAGAVCLLVVVALVGFSLLRKAQTRARQQSIIRNFPSSPPLSVRQQRPLQANLTPKPADPKITTDPLTAVIPDAPLSGTVRGAEFKLDEAVVTPTGFQLKQGKEFFPDASLNFFLFLKSGEKLEGRKIIIAPDGKAGLRPHIHAARKEKKGSVPRTLIASDNYALRVEFGERNGNKIPGRIYLEMGESFGTKIAGTFEAKATP